MDHNFPLSNHPCCVACGKDITDKEGRCCEDCSNGGEKTMTDDSDQPDTPTAKGESIPRSVKKTHHEAEKVKKGSCKCDILEDLEALASAFESPWLARTEDEWYINKQRAQELRELITEHRSGVDD